MEWSTGDSQEQGKWICWRYENAQLPFSLKTTPEAALKSVAEAPSDENKCRGLSSNVVIGDKKLSTDKSLHETASNQSKADYKDAENAI